MIHHPGEVIAVFRPEDKNVKSSDNDTLATVIMWDENVFTLVVDQKIAGSIKQNDKIFVDYRPVNIGTGEKSSPVQKQTITKIIKGDQAEQVWKQYRKWFEQQKQKSLNKMAMHQDYVG